MSNRELRKRLKKARALIADPKHWTQRALARDRHRHEVDPTSPKADRFCALGACVSAGLPEKTSSRLLRKCLGTDVVHTNDGGGGLSRREAHKAILDAFDCAIEKTK